MSRESRQRVGKLPFLSCSGVLKTNSSQRAMSVKARKCVSSLEFPKLLLLSNSSIKCGRSSLATTPVRTLLPLVPAPIGLLSSLAPSGSGQIFWRRFSHTAEYSCCITGCMTLHPNNNK
eukprot:15335061-Ditylum_brightwellii.AAC.1